MKFTTIATYAKTRRPHCINASASKHCPTVRSSISNAAMTSSPRTGHSVPYRAWFPSGAHSNTLPLNSLTTIAVNPNLAWEHQLSHLMNTGMLLNVT